MRNELVVAGILLVITSTMIFLVCHNGVLFHETPEGARYSATNPDARREYNIFHAMRSISALFVIIGVLLIIFGFLSERRNPNQYPTSQPDMPQTQKQPK